jgi:hypothetical protein
MINLFTSYYHNKDRDKEFKFCLEKNLENKHISKVIVFEEDKLDIYHDKLVRVDGPRPTYQDYFNVTDSYPDDVNVIANSDIFFNETIQIAETINQNICYAITRHEWRNGRGIEFQAAHGKQVDPSWSQDAWVFKGKIRITGCDVVMAENLENHAYDTIKFYLGIGGCDNVIARRIYNAGYVLHNPYLQIHALHVHKTHRRPKYSHRMTGTRSQWGGLMKVKPVFV